MINYLVDAGPLIGLLSSDDQWHEWSFQTLSILTDRLATTETALAEACHRLRKQRSALQLLLHMVAEGHMAVAPVLGSHPWRVGQLLEAYRDMDAGDATLVVLSEQHPQAKLITLDRRAFSRYRRADGSLVPSLMPPA
jgi:predicted nucleic acid-binding protein